MGDFVYRVRVLPRARVTRFFLGSCSSTISQATALVTCAVVLSGALALGPPRARADDLDGQAERDAQREIDAEVREERGRARRRADRIAAQDRDCRRTVATWDFPAPTGCKREGRPRYGLVAGGSGLFVTGYALHIIAFSQDDEQQGAGHLVPIVGTLLYTDENLGFRIGAFVGELVGLTMIVLGFVITRPLFVVDETQVAFSPWIGPDVSGLSAAFRL